jgi:O-antigen ligase
MLAMTIDRKRLALIADWEAVAVAASLPWSTSATSILIVVWLLTVVATLDVATVRREAKSAAGGLPVLLWLLAAAGMLWADVSWTERFGGLNGFHRLLMIPLLLAQFRRSANGVWVLYGFFASCVVLLLASWTIVVDPDLAWRRPNPAPGVMVKDVISQSTLFIICVFVLIWRVFDSLRERNWRTALGLAVLALLFLANLVFVAASRADVVVVPFLVLLLGWRQLQWKGAMIAGIAGIILAAGAWTSSPYLRQRLIVAIHDVQDYRASNTNNDVGDHVEFLRKSMTFVRSAPLFGHGTGSITDQFRRSAAGETGAAGLASENPHNQIFAVAIQLGLFGAALLLAMWSAHYLLFRAAGFTAWIGTVVVVENVVSSLTSSHLFDFTHGWLYVFAVGVVGGMMLRQGSAAPMDRGTPVDPVSGPANAAFTG